MVLLALAVLAFDRPEWYGQLEAIAGKLDGRAAFVEFHQQRHEAAGRRPPMGF